MMRNQINSKSFIQSILSNHKLLTIYNSIGRPKAFDVTLRDGLQGLSKEKQMLYTTQYKIKLYNEIIDKYSPQNIEIGSFVSDKVLPIFRDTNDLVNYTNNNKRYSNINNYVLIPNFTQLQNALKSGASNFSLITSVSDSFQYKNTKMSLNENLKNITDIMAYLDDYSLYNVDGTTQTVNGNKMNNIKIYISCINHCPIEGEIKMSRIMNQLIKINNLKPTSICLSDTCGTLIPHDFIDILRNCDKNGIDIKKLSLHLHVKPEREHIVQELVHIALDNGISEFDVSALSSGGCSVTMDENKLAPNMSYEQYYKFLMNYMMSRF